MAKAYFWFVLRIYSYWVDSFNWVGIGNMKLWEFDTNLCMSLIYFIKISWLYMFKLKLFPIFVVIVISTSNGIMICILKMWVVVLKISLGNGLCDSRRWWISFDGKSWWLYEPGRYLTGTKCTFQSVFPWSTLQKSFKPLQELKSCYNTAIK